MFVVLPLVIIAAICALSVGAFLFTGAAHKSDQLISGARDEVNAQKEAAELKPKTK